MRITLQVTEGPHKGQTFTFQGHDTFLVGRSRRAHLQLPAKDLYFSRVHFLVEINPPRCRVMDMGSRNGTFVNGQRVETQDLKDGDQLKAGHTIFRLSLEESIIITPFAPALASLPAPAPSSVEISPAPAPEPPVDLDLPEPDEVDPPAPLPTIPPPGPAPAAPVLSPCAVCGATRVQTPEAGSDTHVIVPRMCLECYRRMRGSGQPVPGYRVLRELGRGGMGVVYLAARDHDGQLVALKTVLPAVETHPKEIQKFLREADILRQLNHPRIVRFLDMNAVGGQLWFAMEFIPGTDAARLLKKQGPMPVERAVRLVCQALKALEYAHDRGFIHRDIKPANLLVTRRRSGREVAVLADFGLARVYQASRLSGLTMTGAMGGTPLFMPPEQITHYRQARPAADQYAAAMTLYNLLTGHYGFDLPEHFKHWIAMILEDDPVPLRDRRPDLPAELATVVHRALRKDPEDRFPDVRAFRTALKAFLS